MITSSCEPKARATSNATATPPRGSPRTTGRSCAEPASSAPKYSARRRPASARSTNTPACDELLTEDGPEREPAGAVGGFRIGAHLLVEQERVVADKDAPPARVHTVEDDGRGLRRVERRVGAEHLAQRLV